MFSDIDIIFIAVLLLVSIYGIYRMIKLSNEE